MARLLVISYFYAPTLKIGAIRWSKIVKHLTRAGHEVDVITSAQPFAQDSLLARDLGEMGNVIHIDHWYEKRKKGKPAAAPAGASAAPTPSAAPSAVPSRGGIIGRIKKAVFGMSLVKAVLSRIGFYKELRCSRSFARNAERYMLEQGGFSQYDAVVTTYGPIGDVLLGLRIKKRCPELPLIADFRDPIDGVVFPRYQDSYRKRIQAEICGCADRIIAVTNGYRERICGERWKEKSCVITNGYDAADIADLKTLPIKDDSRLTLCFTGNPYRELATALELFRAIAKLVADGVIDKEKIVFHYCGKGFPVLLSQAQQVGCEWLLLNHGQVDRTIALAMQNSADIPVLMVWNKVGGEGIVSGKFYEYLAQDNPMLALVSGELPSSELGSLIEQYDLGFAYEEASDNFEALCDWVAERYKKKQSGASLKRQPSTAALEHFEYSSIAKRVEEVILRAI